MPETLISSCCTAAAPMWETRVSQAGLAALFWTFVLFLPHSGNSASRWEALYWWVYANLCKSRFKSTAWGLERSCCQENGSSARMYEAPYKVWKIWRKTKPGKKTYSEKEPWRTAIPVVAGIEKTKLGVAYGSHCAHGHVAYGNTWRGRELSKQVSVGTVGPTAGASSGQV